MEETPVLIVGAGPVGMTTGLLLDRLGVPNLIIDRTVEEDFLDAKVAKARGIALRSMEIFRVLGLEEPLVRRGLAPGVAGAWLVESAVGPVHGIPVTSPLVNASPCRWGTFTVGQDVVEEELLAAVRDSANTSVQLGVELVDLEIDEDGVSCSTRDVRTGRTQVMRARFVVAADGGASTVRELVGIETESTVLAHLHSYYYETPDPSQLPAHVGAWAVLFLLSSDSRVPFNSSIACTSRPDRWIFAEGVAADQEYRSTDDLVEIIRAQWGIPDLSVRIINRWRWRVATQFPTTYRFGPVVLAGDAAHVIPPAGGMGMNCGLADAQNLAWKLALVVKGCADPKLLDTYEVERRPAADWVMHWAAENLERTGGRLSEAFARRHEDPGGWQTMMVEFGRQHAGPAVSLGHEYAHGAVVNDESDAPPRDPLHYWPSDRPGARFPHLWLDAPGQRMQGPSTIDWFIDSFALVHGPSAEAWQDAAAQVAEELDVPLVARRLPHLGGPVSIGRDGAVLVRPDGHVAWRPSEDITDRAKALRSTLEFLLAGGTESESGRSR